MKIISYSKSHFVRLRMFHEKWEHDINYEIDTIINELRKELKNKTEFGQIILENLDQKNGFLTKEHQKKLWKQILNKSIKTEILFLNINYSKEAFEILLESAKELNLEIKTVLNLFLPEKTIENKARIFSRNHKTPKSISEEEFVEKMLNIEQKRISLVEEIKDLVSVININSDCSENEIVINILKGIKIGHNNG